MTAKAKVTQTISYFYSYFSICTPTITNGTLPYVVH